MMQDQLTPEQRLRLEALAQAVALECARVGDERGGAERTPVDRILNRASCFETFLKNAPPLPGATS